MERAADEDLVYVVDLRAPALAETAELVRQEESEIGRHQLPAPPAVPIGHLALLVDGQELPVLLPLEPTEDVELLDALARLLRIAVLTGERIPTVAVEYGGELERELAFSRRLPTWAYRGLPAGQVETLPTALQVVLGPRSK